jgi:hypothetical protein
VSRVRYPHMRREVLRTLASLADRDYQEQAWIRHEHSPPTYEDFRLHIHVLYDDCQVLPEPQKSVGPVLLPGDELVHLLELGRVLDALLDQYGESEDRVFMSDVRWDDVIRQAGLALAAMVRAWGFSDFKDDTNATVA